MKKLFFLFPLLLFSCNEPNISPHVKLQVNEPTKPNNWLRPTPMEPANRCAYSLNYDLNAGNKFELNENLTLQYLHGLSTSPGQSYIYNKEKQNEKTKDQCEAIMDEIYFNYPNINLDIHFKPDFLDKCKGEYANTVEVTPNELSYLEINDVRFFGMHGKALSSQRLSANIKCSSGIDVYCMYFEKDAPAFFKLVYPKESCTFIVEKQPLELENGSRVLINLRGKLLLKNYEPNLEINHISFD